jgi:hypothetical protein
MKFRIFFLALVVLTTSLGANHSTNTVPATLIKTFTYECNLPAPTNLVSTAVGATYLSFAWGAVSGASGYDIELTKVSTNTLVYSQSNFSPTAVSISSLEAGTLYRMDVWPRCNASQVRGGNASMNKTTDDFILDDLVSGYYGIPVQQNPYELFPSLLNQNKNVYFRIEGPGNNPVIDQFTMQNLYQSMPGRVHLVHLNSNNTLQIVNHDCIGPSATSFISSSQFAYVTFSGPEACSNKVLTIQIYHANGNCYLSWNEENSSGYKIKILTTPKNGMGIINNPKNKLQSQDEINGIEERNESITDSTPFAIWPNPFNDLLYIQGSTPAHVQLFDINGKLIYQYTMDTTETNTTIPTADLAKGVYLIRYETADSVKTIKVVKTN